MQTHVDSSGSEEALARWLMRLTDRGALASLLARPTSDGGKGWPYASLALVATDLDGAPLLMLSNLADHSRNIAADPRVSLLLAPDLGAAEPLAHARLSLIGEARPADEERVRQRFLDRHPEAGVYAGFTDFRCYRVRCDLAHLIAGFGRIRWLESERLLLGPAAFQLWPEGGNLCRRLNVEETGLVERLGVRASGVSASWRLTGIDAEGCDFRAGERTARWNFPVAVESVGRALSFIREE
ncbi:MAG TPA: heme iron utilization protein [Alphaproteobacteria bacterium]|nr:heme iron utilization protein [Alphaproteobacteria bacterium]